MTTRKILFISEINPFSKIIIGGTIGGQKNYEALKRYYGNENVYLALISNEDIEETDHVLVLGKHRGKAEYFINTLFLWNCYNRRTVKRIMAYSATHQINEFFLILRFLEELLKERKKMGNIHMCIFIMSKKTLVECY